MVARAKDFDTLKSQWYGKLAKEGFVDIEDDRERIKKRHGSKFAEKRLYNETRHEAHVEYYQLAGKFLNDYEFETKKDKAIWQLHSEGVYIRAIVVALKKKRFKTYKDEVHRTINELAEVMLGRKKSR